MKVFYVATPRGLDKYAENYKRIAEAIEKLGHKHTIRFIIDFEESFYKLPKKMVRALRQSYPSA